MEKICTKCVISKPITEYYKSPLKYNSSGYKPECKECCKKREKSTYNGEYHKNRLQSLSEDQKQHRTQQLTINAQKRRQDPIVRLKESIRTRIYNSLKSNKTKHTVEYLGCSIEEYRKYIEQQFQYDMTWSNYGEIWEIDHIMPCDSFDLSDNDEIFRCFNYKNTRPLKICENRSKSNKII